MGGSKGRFNETSKVLCAVGRLWFIIFGLHGWSEFCTSTYSRSSLPCNAMDQYVIQLLLIVQKVSLRSTWTPAVHRTSCKTSLSEQINHLYIFRYLTNILNLVSLLQYNSQPVALDLNVSSFKTSLYGPYWGDIAAWICFFIGSIKRKRLPFISFMLQTEQTVD